MGKADGGLRKELQKGLPKPDWRWTPIETGGTQNGVPDSYFANREKNVSGWIECKKTDGWAVKFESHQVQWIKLHVDAGVRIWVAIRASGVGSGGGKGDALWIAPGQIADVLDIQGLNGTPRHLFAGVWFGPPRSWDWRAISDILTR